MWERKGLSLKTSQPNTSVRERLFHDTYFA